MLIDEPVDTHGWCFAHHKKCPYKAPTDVGGAQLFVEVGGNVCTPWSSAGSRHGWLDPVSLPNLVWLWDIRSRKPDIVVNECTPFYEADVVLKFLGPDEYDSFHLKFGPDDLGIPVSRDRLYSVFTRYGRCQLVYHGFRDIRCQRVGGIASKELCWAVDLLVGRSPTGSGIRPSGNTFSNSLGPGELRNILSWLPPSGGSLCKRLSHGTQMSSSRCLVGAAQRTARSFCAPKHPGDWLS